LARLPKVGRLVAELWRAVWLYRCRGRSVGLALLLAILANLGFVLTFYLAALALCPAQTIPSPAVHCLLVPVGLTVQAGFPAPGGMGGVEYVFGQLYALLACAFASGVLASLLKRAIEWLLGLAGYLVSLRLRPTLQPAPQPGTITQAPDDPGKCVAQARIQGLCGQPGDDKLAPAPR
jgi:hypothetical protein